MLKKHHFALLAFLATLFGIAATDSINGVHNAGQPPTIRTGAPGETNCTGCHSGTVNSGGGSLSLTGLPAGGYVPGQVYTLTATVNDVSQPVATRKYGFSLTALNPSNAMAGSFTLTSATTTSLANATVSGGSRSYVGHKTANSSSSWSFNWTAPATAVGTVTLYMAGNAANGVSGSSGDKIYTSSFPVTQAPAPTADFTTSATTICAGSSITFTNTSTGSPTSQSWNFGNGQTATTAGPHTIAFNTAGTFNVALTATNGVGSNTKTVSVTVNPAPTPVIQATNTTFCEGGNATLSTTTAYSSYAWSSGGTAATVFTDSSLCQTVTVTDGNGCTATSQQLCVTEVPLPSVGIFPSQTTFCEGDSSLISASIPFTAYQWSTGATTSNIWVKATDTITLIATQGLCSDTSNTLIVTMLPNPAAPQITPANPEWCAGENDTLSISGNYASVTWSNQTVGNTNVISTPGNYFVTVTDANGCAAVSDTITAIENPIPQVTISGPSTFCAGSTATLCGPFLLNGSALWNTGDTTFCLTTSVADTFSLSLTSEEGCVGTSAPFVLTQGVVLTPTLLINGSMAGDTTIFCAGDSLLLSVGQFANYLWSNGDTTSTLVVDTTGSFSVTVGDGLGCNGTTTTLHTVENPIPVVDMSYTPMAEPMLHATPGFAQYQWYFNGSPIPNSSDSTHQALDQGEYSVCVTDVYGCTACSTPELVGWFGVKAPALASLTLAPNPTRDRIAISLTHVQPHEVASVTVADLMGRSLQTIAVSAAMTADLTGLAAGTYLVQVRLHSGAVVSAPMVKN